MSGIEASDENGLTCKVDIKLAGSAQPLILIPTFVNEEGPYDFILDTGAGICLIDPGLADRLCITRDQIKTGLGAAGSVTIGLGTAKSVRVGRAHVSGLQIGITEELQRIASAVGVPIQGALGFSFLRTFRLVLDYQTRTIEFAGNGRFPACTGVTQSEVNFGLAAVQKPLLLIPVWLNERGPYQFALDTGASTTVISSETARELCVAGSTIPDVTAGGGNLAASAGRLNTIAVGDVVATNVAVVILSALNSISEAVGRRIDGILGYNFLRAFTVTIDYPRQMLALRRASALE